MLIRKVIGRRAVNRLIRHKGHLKSYTLLDCSVFHVTVVLHMIKLSGARDEPNSSIVYGLQT